MASSATELARQLRRTLQGSPEAPTREEFQDLIGTFVRNCSEPSSSDIFHDLESELVSIHNEVVHHDDLTQDETFLFVLYNLRQVIPPSSLISTWFELALRHALREPKLSVPAVNHAKELVLAALDSGPSGAELSSDAEQDKKKEKVGDFRRRLMDLYLLDAYNESSGDDVLEWAELDAHQQGEKACWKMNLENVLVRAGLERPQDFLTEIYHCFILPSSRLQLLILLNAYTSDIAFPANAPILASHPLMTSLLHSLLFDNSSTVCTAALALLTKLLPIFAVKACQDLKRLLPQLLTVLGRTVCWRDRSSLPEAERVNEFVGTPGDPEDIDLVERANTSWPPIREDLEWDRLEQTFLGPASSAPSVHRYFTFLYYLFPCNTIRFMRYPVSYLRESGMESPYAVDWEDALDEEKIRSKCEPIMRGHVLHPLLIWRGPVEELSQPDFFAQHDIAQIVGDATMLDTRNASLAMSERDNHLGRARADVLAPSPTDAAAPAGFPQDMSSPADRASTPISIAAPGSKLRISLQDMIATSVALKSGLDNIEIIDPSPAWSGALFPQPPRTRSPSRDDNPDNQAAGTPSTDADAESVRPVSEREPVRGRTDDSSRVAQALAGLQREVLTLRNDLNLELWMTRENVRHLGRLYEDRVLSKTAEFERQGLHNKMREYKAEVFRLQKELQDHKDQTSTVKGHFADWNKKLQDKLTEFRNEKKSWIAEAAAMRAADKEAKDTFMAQRKLLEEATQRVFQLETKIKENAHKVDRLHDYELQIDQLIKLQRLWETDVQKLNGQAQYLQVFASEYRKMELRLECQEKTQAEMQQYVQSYRQQIGILESQLALAQKQLEGGKNVATLGRLSMTQTEYKKLAATNQRLRDENSELGEEVEEVKAMVDYLKQEVKDLRAQVAGSRRTESPEVRA
ncbi:hypothetical protein B0H21DRAFT_716276 [Amylocystis lapponica]|nr:hypothetical protein B0H21DRAFT_716276 [Amylocystis lapponica]